MFPSPHKVTDLALNQHLINFYPQETRAKENINAIWTEWATKTHPGMGEYRDIALNRIQECLAYNKHELNLSSLNLTDLPSHFPKGLDSLFVCHNQLTEFPSGLPESLRYIDISHNSIPTLPKNLPSALLVHSYANPCSEHASSMSPWGNHSYENKGFNLTLPPFPKLYEKHAKTKVKPDFVLPYPKLHDVSALHTETMLSTSHPSAFISVKPKNYAKASCSLHHENNLPKTILNRDFFLEEVNGKSVRDRIPPCHIRFKDDESFLARVDNCFSGQVACTDGKLTFSSFVSTLMTSSPLEKLVQSTLTEGPKLIVEGTTLILKTDNTTLVYTTDS